MTGYQSQKYNNNSITVLPVYNPHSWYCQLIKYLKPILQTQKLSKLKVEKMFY